MTKEFSREKYQIVNVGIFYRNFISSEIEISIF